MADDLDAFFDEVSEVAAKAPTDDLQEAQQQTELGGTGGANDDGEIVFPPTKKAKTIAAASKPTRPLGVVVASSSSVVTKTDPSTSYNYNQSSEMKNPLALNHLQPFAPLAAHHPPPLIGTKATVGATAATIANPPLPPHLVTTADPSAVSLSNNHNQKAHKRKAGGKLWVDPTLGEWPENDFRIFVGNLSKDVSDEQLWTHFANYPSLAMVKIVRDPKGTSKGFGFCSFLQPMDYAKALREMDQTWLSSRPIRIKRSDWKEHELKNVVKKEKKLFKQQHR